MSASNRSISLFVFAAGLGTRLRPATLHNPKPCIPLMQIPLGYYFWPYLEYLKIDQFIANTFYLPEQIKSLYKKINSNFLFSDETDFIKGSAGGLRQADYLLKNTTDTLAVNADEIFFTNEHQFLFNAWNVHQSNDSLATLIVTTHPEAGHKFGAIWINANGFVKHIGKDNPVDPELKPMHFIGLQILNNLIIKDIPKDKETNIFYDVLINYLNDNKVKAYTINCDWYEVGNTNDYHLAKTEIAKKLSTSSVYQIHIDKLRQLPCSNLSDLSQ